MAYGYIAVHACMTSFLSSVGIYTTTCLMHDVPAAVTATAAVAAAEWSIFPYSDFRQFWVISLV